MKNSAPWMVFFSGVADTVDGGLARATGTISVLGKQLDSLSDMVCAGVAPALIVYRVYFENWGNWGVLVSFAWVAFVALRLARFNATPNTDPNFFVGIPCPIAATVVCQYFVFSRAVWGNDGHVWIELALIAVLGALMVSRVPYWRSATLMPGEFFRHVYGAATVATFAIAAFFPNQAIFVATATSVVAATIFHGTRASRPAVARPQVVSEMTAMGRR